MASTENIYHGSGFGFDPTYGLSETYGESFLGFEYRIPSSQFGFPTDPTTANQLQAVSAKISTGAKTIEVSGLGLSGGGAMKHMDTIPKQHWKEIERLKKLSGVDLTFHGPLVEPTGAKRGWQESDRKEVERQMISAVKRAHQLDPKGNLVVTFHSSNGLPNPETIGLDDKGEKEIKEFWVVDESGGPQRVGVDFQNIVQQPDYFKSEQAPKPEELIKKRNDETWFAELQRVNFNVHAGSTTIERIMESLERGKNEEEKKRAEQTKTALLEAYKRFVKGDQEILNDLDEKQRKWMIDRINELTHGDIYLRESYAEFQNLFNKAYKAAKENDKNEDINKLEAYRNQLLPKIKEIEEDPSKVNLLGEELTKGVNMLRTISSPQILKPLKKWAIDKAGESFANTAFAAYKEFKEHAPIISIENPPYGMGLSTGEDLKELVEETRKKFIDKAQKEGLSKSDAKEQAEKLIGVTWDVGHINMLRGHGFEEKHIIKQTKEVAPFVKHVHLSDNFGLEHTELPMGMGNVPTKKMLELINQYNKQVKKIVETGDWFSRQGGLAQTQTPVKQTFQAFGPSVYSTGESPYWNQAVNLSRGYFVGQGTINPDIHHQLYGAGFTNLPVELGGQMAGRSRVSGAPIE